MAPQRFGIVFRSACVALATAFIYSGLSKLFNFDAAIAEATHFGLQPAALIALATIVTQLGGSALLVLASHRLQALGAFILAGFTIVATLIGHAFWKLDGIERFHNLNSFLEHIGLVGGLMLIAAMAWSGRSDAA